MIPIPFSRSNRRAPDARCATASLGVRPARQPAHSFGSSALVFMLATTAVAAPRLASIQLSITNPTDVARTEDVVLPVARLKRLAPALQAGNTIVLAGDAALLTGDALRIHEAEVPSQADDLDGDGKFDELVFQIDLGARQTRSVTIAYGDQGAVQRLRAIYPPRTAMKFATRYEGLGWESEEIAWRIYFDKRNAIDIYGKRRPGLYLDVFSAPEYVYHMDSPMGRDIFKVDPTLGVGSVAAMVEGKPIPVATVGKRTWRVLASGPVRSVGEYEFQGWEVGGKTVNMVSRFTQWAGEHGFHHRITVSGGDRLQLVAALPRKPRIEPLGITLAHGMLAVATWGHQVVEPGTRASTVELPDQELGLALIGRNDQLGQREQDAANYLFPLLLKDGATEWYVAAMWDQENTETLMMDNASGGGRREPRASGATRERFVRLVHETSVRLADPARIDW